MAKKEKKEGLEGALLALEAKFGKGAIFTSNSESIAGIDWISSGSIQLDIALGGGMPKGRIVEVYGMESAGKTSICLHVIKEAQKKGLKCAFVDAEHGLDLSYTSNIIGVNINELLISQPDCGEQALDTVDLLVRSKELGVIVVDSVAALVPQVELEGAMDDQQMGVQARMMGKAMRKLSGIISKSNTLVIFVNQNRSNIGYMVGGTTTTGGKALRFYASQRIKMSKSGSIKRGEDIIGIEIKAEVTKNKVAPPFKVATLSLFFDFGICKEAEVLDIAVKNGIIKKNGAWYSYPNEETKIGQGETNAILTLRNNEQLFLEIMEKL